MIDKQFFINKILTSIIFYIKKRIPRDWQGLLTQTNKHKNYFLISWQSRNTITYLHLTYMFFHNSYLFQQKKCHA